MTRTDWTPHYHVTAALIFKGGRVLIAKRPEGAHLAGFWEFPGGKQEPGESLTSCVEREVAEELGLRVKARERVLTVCHEYPAKRISLHAFRCSVISGTPSSIQCAALKWVPPDGLETETFPPPDRRLIEVLFRKKRTDTMEENGCFTGNRMTDSHPRPTGSG